MLDEAIASLQATVASSANMHHHTRVFLGEALEIRGDVPAAIRVTSRRLR